MKRVGAFLKSAREEQNLSIHQVSRETRIKPEFLEAIENEKWEKLPELPVVAGFVKNIADALNLNREQAIALLRRDYPPKKLVINPTPDIKSRFSIGPRVIFAAFVFILLLGVGSYLFYQYRLFVNPPVLVVLSPVQNEKITGKTLIVRGTTDAAATIRVNNQPADVDQDGSFTANIDVIPETHEVEIKAVSRSGKETVIHRTIMVTQ